MQTQRNEHATGTMTRRRRNALSELTSLLHEAHAAYEAADALSGPIEGTPEAEALDAVYYAASAITATTAPDLLAKLLIITKWGQYDIGGSEEAAICAEAAAILGVPAPADRAGVLS